MTVSYPKIQTVWKRDKDSHFVLPGEFRLPQFSVIHSWIITEKVDGMNIRVSLGGSEKAPALNIEGRTAGTQFSKRQQPLLQRISELIDPRHMVELLADKAEGRLLNKPSEFTLYGEGYGPGIQKGGIYSSEQNFVLFDARIDGYWLKWANVRDIADELGIEIVPWLPWIDHFMAVHSSAAILPPRSLEDLDAVQSLLSSISGSLAPSSEQMEGIVVRSNPLLLSRTGQRVIWKLKRRDFGGQNA